MARIEKRLTLERLQLALWVFLALLFMFFVNQQVVNQVFAQQLIQPLTKALVQVTSDLRLAAVAGVLKPRPTRHSATTA